MDLILLPILTTIFSLSATLFILGKNRFIVKELLISKRMFFTKLSILHKLAAKDCLHSPLAPPPPLPQHHYNRLGLLQSFMPVVPLLVTVNSGKQRGMLNADTGMMQDFESHDHHHQADCEEEIKNVVKSCRGH